MVTCGSHGWLMIAGGLAAYGVLVLTGAALIKYLFFADNSRMVKNSSRWLH
jgi:hypothetical protein